MPTFGQKGGEGPTAGRKATTYIGMFPNGISFKKRAFFADGPAFAACYQDSAGKWHVAGIDQKREDMPAHYTAVPVIPRSALD